MKYEQSTTTAFHHHSIGPHLSFCYPGCPKKRFVFLVCICMLMDDGDKSALDAHHIHVLSRK